MQKVSDRVKRLRKKLGKILGVLKNKDKTASQGRLNKNVSKFFTTITNFTRESVPESVCGPNCSQCCYRSIHIYSHTEEAYLLRALEDLGWACKQSELKPKIEKAWEKWKEICTDMAMNPVRPAFPADVEAIWMEEKTPCPLLNQEEGSSDGLCLLYPKTPLECRMVFKFEEPCLGPEDAGISLMTNTVNLLKETIDMCHKIDTWSGESYVQTSFLEVLRRWVQL